MIRIDHQLTAAALVPAIDRVFELSGQKIALIQKHWDRAQGHAGVHGARPLHHPRLDRVDAGLPVRLGASCSSTPPATQRSSSSAARGTLERMASHVTHIGVHDHGFNNVTTYGNLLRLLREGRHRRRPVGASTSTSWR